MKRLIISLVAVVMGAMGMYAQTDLVATLSHGSNTQAFYGYNALSAAHAAAVDGDVITLSAGSFESCDITKAITLRGAGMKTASNKIATYLTENDITIELPEESSSEVVLEGINVSSSIYANSKTVFKKCRLGSLQCSKGISRFEHCFITGIIRTRSYDGNQVTIFLTNCFVRSASNSSESRSPNDRMIANNCIFAYSCSELKNSTISNSLFYKYDEIGFNPGTMLLDATCTATNCVAITTGNNPFGSLTDSSTNIVVDYDSNTHSEFFQESADNYPENWVLTDAAATTYLGNDGTQVGIYGGANPFSMTPSYPLVKTFDVIGSHKNGKLNVKINVE